MLERARSWVRGSLRGALTFRLVAAFAVIGIVAAGIAYRLGHHYASLAYDRSLSDDVITLASQVALRDGRVVVNLPPEARHWLLANEGEQVLYRVVDLRDGKVVDSNAELGPWGTVQRPPSGPQFRDAAIQGVPFRIGQVTRVLDPGGVAVLVEVGETLGRREWIAQETFAGTLALFGLIAVISIILAWNSIDRVLAPLKTLQSDAAVRSGTNLLPLEPSLAPLEVRGLIAAINRMMQRVSDTIDTQRRFTANVAHQLRTPIAALRLHAQLAQDEISRGDVGRRLKEIDRGAGRAARVIDQLLTLAQSEAGSVPADFNPVDLIETAAQVIQRHLPAAERKHIDLGYSGPDSPVHVLGNETLLAELISNLVDNAVRHVAPQGTVTVQVSRADASVMLSVVDDGPGIGTLAPDTLFERFRRGETANDAGAGLGLAIVKEIAVRHAGVVSCASPPGGGFRVMVRFPDSGPARLK
jgi:two-component system, OmpR family, sensor histidine kinase TctE